MYTETWSGRKTLGGYYLSAHYRYDQPPTSVATSSQFAERRTFGSYSLKFNLSQVELKVPLCYWKPTPTIAKKNSQKHASSRLKLERKVSDTIAKNLRLTSPTTYLSAKAD